MKIDSYMNDDWYNPFSAVYAYRQTFWELYTIYIWIISVKQWSGRIMEI